MDVKELFYVNINNAEEDMKPKATVAKSDVSVTPILPSVCSSGRCVQAKQAVKKASIQIPGSVTAVPEVKMEDYIVVKTEVIPTGLGSHNVDPVDMNVYTDIVSSSRNKVSASADKNCIQVCLKLVYSQNRQKFHCLCCDGE